MLSEHGLDVKNQLDYLRKFTEDFSKNGIKLSFFVDPDIDQIDAVFKLGVKVIEIHSIYSISSYRQKRK